MSVVVSFDKVVSKPFLLAKCRTMVSYSQCPVSISTDDPSVPEDRQSGYQVDHIKQILKILLPVGNKEEAQQENETLHIQATAVRVLSLCIFPQGKAHVFLLSGSVPV